MAIVDIETTFDPFEMSRSGAEPADLYGRIRSIWTPRVFVVE
jgi:hypothetical protein